MKRRLILAMLLLVGGAIVNVAVAWAHPYILPSTGVADRPWSVCVRMRHEAGTGLPMRAVRWTADGGFVPHELLWPGFLVNTFVDAALIWYLVFAAIKFERRSRIQRGLCPKCAYDLRGNAAALCPECGTSVPS